MAKDAKAQKWASAAKRAALDLAKYDGYSVISNRTIRPISTSSSGYLRSTRIAQYIPFNALDLRLVYENADTGNAPQVQTGNPISWSASVEPTGVAVASASGVNVASVATATRFAVSFGGRRSIEVKPSSMVVSDPLRGIFRRGTVAFVHATCQAILPAAPSAPTLSAVAGGNLTAATYAVGVTLVYEDGSETPCSVATTQATSAGNLTIRVTGLAAATYPGARGYKVYTSFAGAVTPLYYAASGVVPMGTNFDIAILPSSSSVSTLKQAIPGSAAVLPIGGYVGGGTATMAIDNGETIRTTIDLVEEGFAGTASTSTSNVGHCAVLARDPSGKVWPSACIGGDSIHAGTADDFEASDIGGAALRCVQNQAGIRVYSPTVAPLAGHIKIAVPGQTIAQFISHNGRLHLQKALLCTHYYSNLGTNDIGVGAYAAAALRDKITEALLFTLAGRKVRFTTILPRTSSTDGWTTTANQSMPNGGVSLLFAGNKAQFNNVLRSSASATSAITGEAMFRNVATSTPATDFYSGGDSATLIFTTAYPFQTGTETIKVNGATKALTTDYTYVGSATINGVAYASGVSFVAAPGNGLTVVADYTRCEGFTALVAAAEILAGSSPKGAVVIIDPAALVETNGAGVLTVGGHWWAGPAGAAIATGLSASGGATTTTITTTGLTQDQYRGYAIRITADPVTPAAVGQVSTIVGNTATVITFQTMTTAPSTSATYEICRVLPKDGTHMTPDGVMTVAPAYAAQMAIDLT